MANIKFFALGGLGENGKNMYVVEVNERIFVLDAGLKYPDIDMYGVDAVIADISYLIENKNRIEGVFISHGHEDHISALPYLLKQIPLRVYGTHFTICLIENLLADNKMDKKDYKLFRINENKILKFGNVNVSFFNTTHSIPESVAIAINTEDGSIVYCTDFNFSPIYNGNYQTSFDKITDLGKKNVLALLSESLGAGTIDRIKNDSFLEHNYKNVLINAKGRIIVSAYSSDLSRIQKIINMSVERGKRIAIIGRKAEKIVDVAIKSNYLKIPDGFLTSLKTMNEKIDQNVDNNLVVIVTGVRHEPYNLLVRMAVGEDNFIKINEEDNVVIMCPPVPGTEKYAINALNSLYRYDVNVKIFDKKILSSTHAGSDDLKLLYTMLKPKYIIPIKGEYRHMYEQYLVAKNANYTDENVFLIDNGVVLNFENGNYQNESSVHVGDTFVDGSLVGHVNESIIKNRENLAEEGVVIFNINYDSRLRKASFANFITKGFISKIPLDELQKSINDLATKIANNNLVKKQFDLAKTKSTIEEEISKLIFRFTKHRPEIICEMIDISK